MRVATRREFSSTVPYLNRESFSSKIAGVSYCWFTVILETLLPGQVPADWECWAIDADDVDIIVHIPDCCLSSDRIVKKVIRVSVTVKVGHSHQGPATGNVRPISASKKCSS